jgi:hypothetical protein
MSIELLSLREKVSKDLWYSNKILSKALGDLKIDTAFPVMNLRQYLTNSFNNNIHMYQNHKINNIGRAKTQNTLFF